MSPEYKEIPVDQIIYSPFNTRGEVSDEEIAGLAETMKSGNDVPIKVRPRYPNGKLAYEVVYGERRVKALKKAGIATARALVEELSDEEVLMQQWNENEEHKDISDYAKALKLQQIMGAKNINQLELSKLIGKTPAWVSYALSMLKLPERLTRVNRLLTEKQARVILAAPPEVAEKLIADINEQFRTEGTLPSSSQIEDMILDLTILKEQDDIKDHVCEPAEGSTECRICHRPLTAPESVAAGIGPVCAAGGSEVGSAVGNPPTNLPTTLPTETKPLTLEEKAFKLLDELHEAKHVEVFGEPGRSFMVETLRYQLHIYLPDSDNLIAKYKARAKAPIDLSPPFKLIEVKEEPTTKAIHLCPLCGKPNPQPDLDHHITAFAELLVTEGVLPIGLAEKVEQALRSNYKPVTLPPEEDEEVLAAESEAQTQEENEDKEDEEHEIEEEHLHQSTDPEEANQ